MGNQKQKWKAEEEEALLAGIAKHGHGKWKNIIQDPEFAPALANRSNIDLKDKWRNLNVSGPGSKDKVRLPKLKAVPAPQNSVPLASAAPSALANNEVADAVMDDPSNKLHDSKNASWYNEFIFEALSTTKDSNGADIDAILSYIEKRQELPSNFRRHLALRLKRLVSQGKLEKVQNNYRIKRDTPLETKPPTPKQKDVRPMPIQAPLVSPYETIQEAAMAAAYKVAEAENKSFLASEAVKEAERVSKMADDADAMLQLFKEIYEQCSRGEIIVLS